MKIDEMVDVFLNLVNFVQQTIFTLAPPSSYTLNLKPLTKVKKLAENLSFHIKYWGIHLKENSEKTNCISPKKTPPTPARSEG